jgi:hypothetical protein
MHKQRGVKMNLKALHPLWSCHWSISCPIAANSQDEDLFKAGAIKSSKQACNYKELCYFNYVVAHGCNSSIAPHVNTLSNVET